VRKLQSRRCVVVQPVRRPDCARAEILGDRSLDDEPETTDIYFILRTFCQVGETVKNKIQTNVDTGGEPEKT